MKAEIWPLIMDVASMLKKSNLMADGVANWEKLDPNIRREVLAALTRASEHLGHACNDLEEAARFFDWNGKPRLYNPGP